MKWIRGLLVGSAILALSTLAVIDPPRGRDLGELRIVVLESDDWGLEGWFPDSLAAVELQDLTRRLPPRLAPYAWSSLETAADVESLRVLLESFRESSGLPAILQANTIMAGPDLDGRVAPEGSVGWPIHPSGSGTGPYRRPGLVAAVDRAIEAGVWRPELHGLTHLDLFAYSAARRRGDRVERRARERNTFAYDGWIRGTELGHDDFARSMNLTSMATALFRRRFGRPPRSVIAPDYRWDSGDERAWESVGIEVVQAKREQIDPRFDLRSRSARLKKWLRSAWDRHRGRFAYLDRWARLEPYGSTDPDGPQCAREAARAVREAWARGEAGVLSIHRVQLASLDPAIAEAGRQQLRQCLRDLSSDGALRFLVDVEVAQLRGRGWSMVRRGDRWVLRNHRGQDLRMPWPNPVGLRILVPGTTILPARAEDHLSASSPSG